VRRRAELLYEQLNALVTLRKQARQELLTDGKKHPAWKLLRSIPALGPIRAAVLVAIVQTPHRLRTKRMLWKYSGFGVVTQTSADQQYVNGQLQRSKKPAFVRGLDPAHNHQLKYLFKSAAIQASTTKGPFQEFYQALVAKGMRPDMARLTLARKIATISWIVWKKGAAFEAKYLKSQTA
jgi:transposase